MSPALQPKWLLVALAIALLALPGCLFGLSGDPNAAESAAYASCEDREGMAAWQRAEAALGRGEDQAALVDLISSTRRCPDLVRAHLAYQDCARRLGGAVGQEMVDFYFGAAEHDSPVPAYLRARLADTAYAQSNALDAIIGKYGAFAWAWLSRARVHRGQGRLAEALAAFGAALRHDPGLVEARYERAQVLAELGRDEEAARDYQAYLVARPADLPAARAYVALLLYRLGRVDQAMAGIKRLAAAGDDSIALRMDRAAALWLGGNPRAAVESYLAILEQAPATARAALDIGLLYYEVVPRTEEDRRRYWPKARIAFELFLATTEPADGHEQFERTWAVPYRLQRIAELLGPVADQQPTLEALRWPDARSDG